MFEGSNEKSSVHELLPDRKIYVVLDKVGDKSKPENLSFGLKIVNRYGDRLASESNNALIVTENSVGLINIQGYYSINNPKSATQIDERIEGMLKGLSVKAEFQADSSEIDKWLKGGSGGKAINEVEKITKSDRHLLQSMWFEKKEGLKNGRLKIQISAEWVSWCGTEGNKRDKRLEYGENTMNISERNYKWAADNVNLTVGSIKNASAEDKWALIPIGKPIMKINLSSRSFNNETIEGTLEPMKDGLLEGLAETANLIYFPSI